MKESSGIIVQFNDRVLLCQRSDNGKWAIPMGGVEENEDPMDAAYREFYEETNLEIVEPIKYLGKIKRYKSGKIKNILNIYLFKVDDEIEPNLSHAEDGFEHTECGYYTKKQLLTLNMDKSLKDFICKIIFDF
jgi:8-oxo-dGTP pyrophosphatase MutT (NUDIX family)